MRHKVSWLVFWVSMVLWFGNMGGCATTHEPPHYNVSEPAPKAPTRDSAEDRGRSVLVRDDAAETVPVAFYQEQPAAPAAETPKPDSPAVSTPPASTEVSKPAATPAAPVVTGDAPSLKGLDRSHWTRIQVKPDVGVTRHFPLYYKDCPMVRPEPAIKESDPIDVQLEAALAGAQNHLWDWTHGQQMLAQPLKFGYDTVVLLPKMVITPPWREATTP